MKTSFWRRWCDSLRSPKPTSPISRARPRQQLLCLEALEDRLTPSLTPQMVLDINPNSLGSNPSEMVAIGSTTYFTANDGVHGIELWKSDGTAAGTVLVKDINPGSGGSYPLRLTNVNGTLFFRAGNGTTGYLWKSDGTAAGTVLVKDITDPNSLTNVNGTLFFSAYGTSGLELWKSDGTAAGTTLVKDIYPGTHRYYNYYGEYRDVANSSNPLSLTNVNGTLVFTADDGTNGRELWKSDGTEAGTVLVNDSWFGAGGSGPSYLTNVNGTLFFSASNGINGPELWKSDGTALGTTPVRDVNGWSLSVPRELTNVNGTLFFSYYGADGQELWKSDGTAAGTTLVKDIFPGGYAGYYGYGPNSSSPSNLTDVNGTLFFTAYDGTNGRELWKSDGTAAGTSLVKDVYPGYHIEYYYDWDGYRQSRSVVNSSDPGSLTNVNGTLFFMANDGTGTKPWQSDGSEAGTVLVANLVASGLTNVNGTLFFSADDGVHGQELWRLVDNGPAPPPPPPSITMSDATVTEGNTGTVNATFTLSLSAAYAQPVTVHYETADGSAAAGSDYTAASGDVTFGIGESTKTITVPVNGDVLNEADETFLVNLSGAANATIADGQGVGTVLNDDSVPALAISDVTVTEGNAGTVSATFTVSLSAASGQTVTVSYATADGTARAGSDYVAAAGSLTFAPGETSKTITVQVNGDRLGEANELGEAKENFFVNLSSPTNATFADGQGVGIIVDDEPRISIGDVTKNEGRRGKTTLFTFTVTLSAAYDQAVTMSYRTVDGTATTSDNDYIPKTGTLTFAPGETTKTISIEVKGDSKKEANETFYLDLFGNSSNSLFTKNRGCGTILNDD